MLGRGGIESKRSKAALLEAGALVLLGATLVSTLLLFTWQRLLTPAWAPILAELSEDGSLYLSISRAGMRVHDVESGREVDRISFTYLSPLNINPEHFWHDHLHLADDLDQDESRFSVNYRSRVQISRSRRYVAATMTSGYLLLWDRQREQYKSIYRPLHHFINASIDDARGLLLVEAMRIPAASAVDLHEISSALEEDDLNEELEKAWTPQSFQVLQFRLEDGTELPAVSMAWPGFRIDDDVNLRYQYAPKTEALLIHRWAHFPDGEPTLLHTVDPSAPSHRYKAHICAPIKQNGEISVCYDYENVVDLKSLREEEPTWKRLETPKALLDKSWLWNAAGADSIIRCEQDDYSDALFVGIWLSNGRTDVFQLPFETDDNGRRLITSQNREVIRLAGHGGEIVDLPLDMKGRVVARRVQMAPYAGSFRASMAVWFGASLLWATTALLASRLLTGGGWLVLLLALSWPGAFCAIELCLADSPMAEARVLAINTGMGLIGLVGAAACFRAGSGPRGGMVCLCALIAIMVLLHTANRIHAIRNFSRGGRGYQGCIF